jgi:putative FmdB family regulatory protein
MPIYEYKCENSHVFDVMQKISDEPLTTCQECGALAKKLLSPVGISFKGSGFYSTDYARNSESTSSDTDSSDSKNGQEGSSDTGKEGSSETSKGESSESSSKGSSESSSKKEE